MCSDETTHVNDTVFLSWHCHTVCILVHFLNDFFDSLVSITFFACLDEISIFNETCWVEDNAFAVFFSNCFNFAEVLHWYRLTTCCVICNSNDYERNFFCVFSENFFKFLNVNITFERNFKLSVFCFVNCAVYCKSFTAFDVTFCCVEVWVTRNDIAILYEVAEENVFSSAALVCWDNIFEACEACDNFFKTEEWRWTSVAFVAHHHSSPLTVAHSASTWVC